MKKKWKERSSIALAVLGLYVMSCNKFAVMLIGCAMFAAGTLDITLKEAEKWM